MSKQKIDVRRDRAGLAWVVVVSIMLGGIAWMEVATQRSAEDEPV
jgi:hypothetical protein